jgi:hypothetical protein
VLYGLILALTGYAWNKYRRSDRGGAHAQ